MVKPKSLSSKSSSLYHPFLVCGVFLLGLILRVRYLGRTLGGGDENQQLLDYSQSSFHQITHSYFYGGHHLLNTLLMRMMIFLFDDENSIAIRFPVFSAGLASLIIIYYLAKYIFPNPWVSLTAMLLLAVCSVHIKYSITARGYSLIIFFSSLALLATLHILEKKGSRGIWSMVMVLAGFLSVYTIPTNIYFIFGLIAWLMMVILLPSLRKEFQLSSFSHSMKIFSIVFASMGTLTLLAYWPLFEQIIREAKEYHLPKTGSHAGLGMVFNIILNTFSLTFPGKLAFMAAPLILIGMFSAISKKKSFRYIPVMIILFPLSMPLITGIGGYPRNYLYNLPIFIIFLSGGIVYSGKWLSSRIRTYGLCGLVPGILVTLFSVLSLHNTIFVMYPALKIHDGKIYKSLILENTNSNSLILIKDTRRYWYGHNVYKEALKNIISSNFLKNIKMVAASPIVITDYRVSDGKKFFSVLKPLKNFASLQGQKVEGQYLFEIGETGRTLLFEDFEAKAAWRTIAGSGNKWRVSENSLAGQSAVHLETGLRESWILQAAIPRKIKMDKPSIIILTWASGEFNNQRIKSGFAVPTIIFRDIKSDIEKNLKLGQVNFGLNPITFKNTPNRWQLFAFIGLIPPGDYLLNIKLALLPNQSFLIDGLCLFLVEIPVSGGYK